MTTAQQILRAKVGLPELAKQLGNVRPACRTRRTGSRRISRRTSSRWRRERPHQGRWCYRKTPLQTFRDSLALAKEKQIA